MTEQKGQHPTRGFGVPTTIAPHHFVVTIPRATRQSVQIVEDLGLHANAESNELIERVVLRRPAWTQIAKPVKRVFNERLKQHDLATSRWKVGENPVDRLLGKELCILAWAVEDLDNSQIGTAVRNWLALRPEERWWLFGMTAATAGTADDRGLGWRAALRHALGDSPETSDDAQERARKGQAAEQDRLPLFEDD